VVKRDTRNAGKVVILSVMLLCVVCTPRNVVRPFSTDECSASREGPREDPDAWCHCCVEHDKKYWAGGTRRERRVADSLLAECVARAGYPRRGRLMYRAVRLWGGATLPFPWRWGYGWRYGHGYGRRSREEQDSVDAVFGRPLSVEALEDACLSKGRWQTGDIDSSGE